jgi:transcriptional regulator with XRE-family HTH domain
MTSPGKPVFPEHIGQVIRVYRLKQQIGRAALAERLGVTPAVLAGIEDGKRAGVPTIKTALLQALGLSDEAFERIGKVSGFTEPRQGAAAYRNRPAYADELDRLAAMPARERRLEWMFILKELAGLDG